MHPELRQHVLDVGPKRVTAHPELVRDIDGRLAGRDSLEDLQLSRREAFHTVRELTVAPPLHTEASERQLDLADRMQRFPSEGAPDRIGEVGDGLRLAQEATGACLDRP